MRELSASLVVEEKGCGGDEKAEEGAGADAGCETDAGAVGSTMTSEELDLDQVKGRMLTMAGLFEIWKGEEVRESVCQSCTDFHLGAVTRSCALK